MFGIVRSGRSQIFIGPDSFFGRSAAIDGGWGAFPLTRFQSLLPTACTGYVREFSIVTDVICERLVAAVLCICNPIRMGN
jgi:hypothetical protein